MYLWPATPELGATLDAACAAARSHPNAWLTARTELEAPGDVALDSIAAADLSILRRIVAIPHDRGYADSAGRFMFIGMPRGTFWIEAEAMQGARVVQWWHKLTKDPSISELARATGQNQTKSSVDLGTRDFTHDEFCTGGEFALGAAAFDAGGRQYAMSTTASDSAYTDVDEPATPIDDIHPAYPDELRKERAVGDVQARFVIDDKGRVDMRTLRIVSSPDYRFTEAVRDAIRQAHFRPARIGGHPVRWLVDRDFVFSLR